MFMCVVARSGLLNLNWCIRHDRKKSKEGVEEIKSKLPEWSKLAQAAIIFAHAA